ncbi:flagellar export chaperone FliS [Cellulomonas citrea]|uniref:flagellar export chaperone FliS n=1 Tax=Cellulomonas citrea TaxID=1909423 RepID=UPI00135B065B|nr:flagellar export chaperone FliS [Cellulomonas citrea]
MYDARSTYLADSVATVGPARLLTMLYDRLVADLDRGVEALERGDRVGGGAHLGHARDIVTELISSLDVAAWEGGPRLMSIYGYLLTGLIESAATGDAAKARGCRDVVQPLAEAWRGAEASLAASAQATRAATTSQGADEIGSTMLGVA